jgi:hypothetical protein
VAEDVRRIGESMEHQMAMRQMTAHLARAGREIQSAHQFLVHDQATSWATERCW